MRCCDLLLLYLPCTDLVGLMGCGRPYGDLLESGTTLQNLKDLPIKKLPCLPYQGLQMKWQGSCKSKKQQVTASNVGFC